MNPRLSFIVYVIAGGILFALCEYALIAYADKPLSQYLHMVDMQHPMVINFFRAWTNLGKSDWYLWPSGIGTLLCFALVWQGNTQKNISALQRKELSRRGQALGFFFASVAISGMVADIIKPIVGRARPVVLARDAFYGFDPFSFDATYNSMPSGHATTAFAVAVAAMALWPRWRGWFISFAIAIGISRIMVNAHFCSDVLAGAMVGILTVTALRILFRRRKWYFSH